MNPRSLFEEPPKESVTAFSRTERDPHLRSTKEVTGYRSKAKDGEFGHVEDFIVDDQTWCIRHLIIDTRNWLPRVKVIVPPGWIGAVSWTNGQVEVPLGRERIEGAPKYDPAAPINREYQTRLYDYYGRPYYGSR